MATDINAISSGIVHLGQEASRVERQSDDSVSRFRQTSPDTADRLTLTDAAYNLRDLEARIEQLPAVDTQRVEAVRQAISDGSYQVDPAKTADKLLGMETTLAGRRE